MKPSFAAFNFSLPRRQALEQVCARCGITVRFAGMNEAGKPLGVLFGILPEDRKGAAAFFTGELLIMNGMTSQSMDRFLSAWRATGQPIIRMKAVVTPTNLTWTPAALAAELAKEDAAMHSQTRRP